jgi:hypothetical protein
MENIEDYIVDCTEFINSAERRSRGQTTTVTYEHGRFEVWTESGTGYCRESTTVYIPGAVIIRMMEHAGYVITRREEP